VIDRSRVAKATLYRHFPSKDDLVVAFLELREQRWTLEWVEAEARRRGSKPEEQLLAIFRPVRRDAHPAGKASIVYLENIRSVVSRLAEEAGLRDPASFARSWHILMKGSIVSATEGDARAARRAQAIARLLIDDHRGAPTTAMRTRTCSNPVHRTSLTVDAMAGLDTMQSARPERSPTPREPSGAAAPRSIHAPGARAPESDAYAAFRYLEDAANDRPARSSRRSQRSWAGVVRGS
jgi:AcrR family transcriptional regulator